MSQVNRDIMIELRYYSSNNFVGDTIEGYKALKLFVSNPAAKALDVAQKKLEKQGLGLKIYDGYRPQRSVDQFIRWARDRGDTLMKQAYYPRIDKSILFEQGYISSRSGHTRGSTVDLTLIDLSSQEELDMGSPWDRFDEVSHHETERITKQQTENRKLLKQVMESCGFRPYKKEWWHYTLNHEPFPDTYFDFVIR